MCIVLCILCIVSDIARYLHAVHLSDCCQVPSMWPTDGIVSFDCVSMRYRPGLPLALNNVSFVTKPYEKIGIVGRTGSGKTSLFSTLFRIFKIQSGHIFVDGVDICQLSLKDLRYAEFTLVVCSFV